MKLPQFKLEEYLAHYEFSSPYLLCCSDAESFSMHEILQFGNAEDQDLWTNLRLSYTEPYGHPLLRNQIAQSLYPTLQADQILCFAGAEEGIYAALHVLCEPDDHVIVLTPCYQSLAEIPRMKQSEVTELPLREENQWKINLDDIKEALKPNTKCLIMNFPHNPTGQVITPEELNALIALCKAHDLWLFSDEVYRLLGQPDEGWASPAAELYPKAISLGVMSKAFGLAGLRIGWIACQDQEILHQIKCVKDYLSICNSAPAEILSLITLKNKDKILARNNAIVQTNLALLDEFMHEYRETFSWVRPQGGCVGFVHYAGPDSIDDFCERLVKEKGVLLLPGSNYEMSGNYFRVGFGRSNMPVALEHFKAFLRP